MSVLNRVSILTMFLFLTACASHKYTIVEPAKEPLTSFEVLEIAPFTTALKDEDSTELSSLFAGRLFDEIQHHREKNVDDRIFNEIALSTNKIDDVLLMESTIISFEKGSRAKRYFFGLGSGKAYCTIQVIFKNKKSGAELARTNFDGELTGGAFGGDAEGTVDGVVKAFIDYMQEYMANSSDDIDVKTRPALTSERRTQGASPVEESQTLHSRSAVQREQPTTPSVQSSTQKVQPSSQSAQPSSQSAQPSSQKVQPSSQKVQPSSQSAQPSSQKVQPTTQRVQPSSQNVHGNQSVGKPNYIVAPRLSRLKEVDARDKDDCRLITSISKNASGGGDISKLVKSVKNLAIAEAANKGADSYFIVNTQFSTFGASVVLEALKCK